MKLLDALAGQNTGTPPLWMMRQAGRTLKSYRDLRAGVPFLEFCKDIERATEATLIPIRELGVDAAILFADILLPAEALAIDFHFEEGIGPVIPDPIRTTEQAVNLRKGDVTDACGYVGEIVTSVRSSLPDDVALIGFCPGPWTLAAYLVQGQGKRGFPDLKRFYYDEPDGFGQFMDLLTETLVDYAQMQQAAGVDAFQIFDTWAELLPPGRLQTDIAPHVRRIADSLDVPVIWFPKGTAQALPVINPTDFAGIGCDWTIDIAAARIALGPDVTLQGNLDPAVLLASPDRICNETWAMLDKMAGDPAYICNLGHGLIPDISEQNVHAFVQAVRDWSPDR